MSIVSITSSGLNVDVDADNPLRLRGIRHRASDRQISGGETSAEAVQRFLVRMPKRLSDPYFLTEVLSCDRTDGGLRFMLGDEQGRFKLTCRMESDVHGIGWTVELVAPAPVWMLEWQLHHLDLRRVVVPALGGQVLEPGMPAGTTVAYKYPFWWQSQFALGEIDDRSGLWLRTMETEPRLKMLRVHREDEEAKRLALGLGFEAEGPLEERSLTAAWHLDGYAETWREPARIHREWMRDAFQLKRYDRHPSLPDWAAEVDFILEIWGMSKEAPEPKHTFDEMIERTRAFARIHDPARTILYLPGFAEEGIDSNAPDYHPAEKCGGREGFRRLVDAAHEQGYRVMIHTNVLALAYSHPLYERFQEFQVVDCFGRPQGWGNDMDGDWLAEPYFAYMNPGHEPWTDHMAGVLGELIDSFDLDAVFLDQTLLAFNVGRGPNFLRGMKEHVERLQQRFPGVLFAGEGFHELIVGALPMTQIHGIDSIAGIHGLEGAREWRRVHPISTYLFEPFTRITAHLLTKHPKHPVFERQDDAYRDLGVVPALVLYDRSQPIDASEVRRLVDRVASARMERNVSSV